MKVSDREGDYHEKIKSKNSFNCCRNFMCGISAGEHYSTESVGKVRTEDKNKKGDSIDLEDVYMYYINSL